MEKIVYIIIVITIAVSYSAWKKPELFNKLLLWSYAVVHRKEYYRMITHGFVHANWTHLIINMLVFLSFGVTLIQYFQYVWPEYDILLFLFLYLSAIVVSSIYSVVKQKDNVNYSAVGASGATSAIIFACTFFNPWSMIYFFGIIPVPGIIFGVIYLIYSYRMGKRGSDNIGHDAHFWGAVYGFIFPVLFKPSLFKHFIMELTNLPF